jgi:Protein of unknown function (DUF3558)
MRRQLGIVLVLGLLLSACGSSGGPSAAASTASIGSAAPPSASADQASPDAPAASGSAAASNPLCDLFTIDEVQALLGAPVGPGEDAAQGTGCQWSGDSSVDATYLQIQVIDDPSYYVEQSEGDGFEQVSGIGNAAFVIPELGGWAGGAQSSSSTFAVAVNGGTASKEAAISLLRQLVERKP